jgi:hypothetical protein
MDYRIKLNDEILKTSKIIMKVNNYIITFRCSKLKKTRAYINVSTKYFTMRCDSEVVKDSPYGHGGEGSNFKLIKLTWQEYIYIYIYLYLYIHTDTDTYI